MRARPQLSRPHVSGDIFLRMLPMLAGGLGFLVIAVAAHH